MPRPTLARLAQTTSASTLAGLATLALVAGGLGSCGTLDVGPNVVETAAKLRDATDKLDPIAVKAIFTEFLAELEKNEQLEEALAVANREMERQAPLRFLSYKFQYETKGDGLVECSLQGEVLFESRGGKQGETDSGEYSFPRDWFSTRGLNPMDARLTFKGKGNSSNNSVSVNVIRILGGENGETWENSEYQFKVPSTEYRTYTKFYTLRFGGLGAKLE